MYYRVAVQRKKMPITKGSLLERGDFSTDCCEIDEVIVKKGIFTAKEIVTGYSFPIACSQTTLFDHYYFSRYCRKLFIEPDQFSNCHLVSALDVASYIDTFDLERHAFAREVKIDQNNSIKEQRAIRNIIKKK